VCCVGAVGGGQSGFGGLVGGGGGGGGGGGVRNAPATNLDVRTGNVRNVKNRHADSLKMSDTLSHPRVASFDSVIGHYLLTTWSRALLEKLTVSQLFKKFTTFCLTRRFITAFTSTRHLFLS